MDKSLVNENQKLVSKDQYFVSVEVISYYNNKNEQVPLLVERGKSPTVGDYVRLFKEHYKEDTELTNMTPYMEFKVLFPKPKEIRMFRILRVAKDFTYRSVTKL